MMAFDECPPGDSPRDYAAKSLLLTQRWLERCFERYAATAPKYGHRQSLFPIVQGCTYPDLRPERRSSCSSSVRTAMPSAASPSENPPR